MKYIFIDTDNGVTTPANDTPDTATSKYHTSGSKASFPAAAACWNDLRNALNNAIITALADDLTFWCKGVANDTNTSSYNVSNAMSATSILIEGDVASAVWDDNKYTISSTNSSSECMVITRQANVTIKNIQFHNNGSNSTPYGVSVAPTGGTSTYIVQNCHVRIEGSGTGTGRGLTASTNQSYTCYFINCIVQQVGSPGGRRDGIQGSATPTVHAYNCVAEGFDLTSAVGFNGLDLMKNCASFNNTDDFSGGSISYCASDDGDGSNAVTAPTWANQFEDYNNGDFRLKSGSTLINAGTDDPGSGLFSTDIAGTARNSPWDIGAYEFVLAGTYITGVSPSSFGDGHAGVVINGGGFGASQGGSKVRIGDAEQTITAWADAQITFTAVAPTSGGAKLLGANKVAVYKA